jgi:hypothetical protein
LGVDNEVVPPSIELASILNFPFHNGSIKYAPVHTNGFSLAPAS